MRPYIALTSKKSTKTAEMFKAAGYRFRAVYTRTFTKGPLEGIVLDGLTTYFVEESSARQWAKASRKGQESFISNVQIGAF